MRCATAGRSRSVTPTVRRDGANKRTRTRTGSSPRGRWYVTGGDAQIGEDRTLPARSHRERAGPARFIRKRPWSRSACSACCQGSPDDYGMVTPRDPGQWSRSAPTFPPCCRPGGARRPQPDRDPAAERWLRVGLRAQQLDWLPRTLASLDRPFVIERPDELASLIIALADRLPPTPATSLTARTDANACCGSPRRPEARGAEQLELLSVAGTRTWASHWQRGTVVATDPDRTIEPGRRRRRDAARSRPGGAPVSGCRHHRIRGDTAERACGIARA